MITLYDLEDNLITVFETYKEYAAWFNTSVKCIHSHMSKVKNGTVIKKRDIKGHKWYKLVKVDDEDV